MEELSVSVVIPTYNGGSKLTALLDSLCSQSLRADEVVVVVDGSNDNTTDVLEPFLLKLPLKVVYQENQGRSVARNNGAKEASGDILIFYDDDITCNEESVATHVNQICASENVIAVGQILERSENPTEFIEFKEFLTKEWTKDLGVKSKKLNKNELFLAAGNMSISRLSFQSLGGFDERLRDGEDFDLAARHHYKGGNIIYDPSNIVFHFSFSTIEEYILRQRQYRFWHAELYEYRKNEPFSDYYSRHHVAIRRSKKLIYSLLPVRIVKWIDSGFFKFLPKIIRYPLYQRVISAFSIYYPNKTIS